MILGKNNNPDGTSVPKFSAALAQTVKEVDWKRVFFITLGIFLFLILHYSKSWADAIDPKGEHFGLTKEGKDAIALFMMAGVWWVFEVIPIGVTAVMIGVMQALFLIRKPETAFTDFFDPSVWFIFGSFVIGMVFTKTGLTKRMAYKMLALVGEKTSMIYLGCFVTTVALTHIMAHTAVAATMFPLLMAVYSLYEEDPAKQTRFGKGLFVGMAYVAGAGSTITLLGSARAAVAIGFFRDMAGREISFFELTKYMGPLGWSMALLLWLFLALYFKPEKSTIPGLKERTKILYERLGPISRIEIVTLLIVAGVIVVLSIRPYVSFLNPLNKSAIILVSTLLFFLLKILDIDDLEEIPMNIILLFGGAMSIGTCLWETGAAKWMAVEWLVMFQKAHWLVFVLSIAFFVLVMTNFIMNVAAIAISLPVALVIAPYLGVAPEVVFFSALATAGMPFVLLVGAAPNAIAYGSRQFTSGEFFKAGIIASLMLMIVLGLFIWLIWPMMGMPVLLPKP